MTEIPFPFTFWTRLLSTYKAVAITVEESVTPATKLTGDVTVAPEAGTGHADAPGTLPMACTVALSPGYDENV